MDKEAQFLQAVVLLAGQYGIKISFADGNVINFIGDENKCIECANELADMFSEFVE